MTRNSVVLPAPLEPIRPVNSLGAMPKLTSRSTSFPVNRTDTRSTERTGPSCAAAPSRVAAVVGVASIVAVASAAAFSDLCLAAHAQHS